MAKKRKAPSIQQIYEQKPKVIREEEEDDESSGEEEDSEEESSEEQEQEDSDAESESESEEDEDEESSSSEDEESDEASKRATIHELLEPFGKDQIINLLKEAASKDAKLLAKIVHVADSDPTHRKIFIHGLGWDATSEQLVQAFKSFGEIEESKLIIDKNTGRAKGYAFVLFKTRTAAKRALKVPQKKIGSRNVSCQLAAVGPGSATQVSEVGRWKIYVGNVGSNVSPEKLKAFFGRFGEIEEGPMGMDTNTNQFKGFAIITYKSAEGYTKVLAEPVKMFENCQLHCKKFVENHTNKNNVAGQSSVSSVNTAVSDVGYGGLGVTPGILGANMNAAGYMMAQNPGIGLAGLATGYNPTGMMASGLNASIAGIGGNYGMNSINPSVISNYGSQAALHGVGPFQSAQTGRSSLGTGTAGTATRTPGSVNTETATLPSYFRR